MANNLAYLSIGSNIEPEHNLPEAIARLADYGLVRRVSSVWETIPVGFLEQANFLNAAVLLETTLSASALRAVAIAHIETALGRVRTENKSGPRTIDLDVTLFNRDILTLGPRHVPDPDLAEHAYIAIPLAEIAGDYVHPENGQSIAQIAARFNAPANGMRVRPDVVLPVDGTLEPVQVSTYQGVSDDWEEPNPAEVIHTPEARAALQAAVRQILMNVGENPRREGLIKTPQRVARMYEEMLAGYTTDPAELLNQALFESEDCGLVIVKDIDFASMCEHHLLPFIGRAHVAYLPNGCVIGLSKIPRVVDMFARRLQLQERLTAQIADLLQHFLQPRGVAVLLEATHSCYTIRGVRKTNATTTTRVMRGEFSTNATLRAEFLQAVAHGHSFS